MSETINPSVYEPQAPVHAGTGQQINNYVVPTNFGAPTNFRRGRIEAADGLRWLWRRFVYPVRFGAARDILRAHHTVFVDAPPGSGRTAAAKMLLWELRRDTESFHELLLDDDGKIRLDPDHIGERDGVWLDLSGMVDVARWIDLGRELSALRGAAQERAGYLVVVLPYEIEQLPAELDRFRVRIERPPVHEVLGSHLRQDGVTYRRPLPALPYLAADPSLEEIARYASLIARARTNAPSGDFDSWRDAADRALSGHTSEIARLVDGLEGPPRALLWAAAMLHGAHADVVSQASAALLRTVAHPDDESPMLERPTLDRQLKDIGAELDDAGQVRFTVLDYDSAVRAYLWTYLPELRDHIRDWVVTTAGSNALTSREQANLVRRLTERCLADDRHRATLIALVERWARLPTSDRQMKAATLVLQNGLRDEKSGWFFRKKVYEWSLRDNPPESLTDVIVAACDEIAVTHPDQALVRLHHAARRERRTTAREALVDLVRTDRRFLRQMLSRLTDTNPETKEWPADVDLFLALADPTALIDRGTRDHALLTERGVRDQLTIGWACAFAQRPDEVWLPRTQQWTEVAAEDERHRDLLLDLLVAGSGTRTAILSRLYSATRAPRLRAVIGDVLLRKINAAQGIQYA